MIRIVICSVIVLFFSSILAESVLAEEMVLFKYLNKNKYFTYITSSNNFAQDRTIRGNIARELLRSQFTIEDVSPEYYKVTVDGEIVFFGFRFKQYTFDPIDGDRFKHVVWVDESNKMIKMEVYDNFGILTFAFSGIDLVDGSSHDCSSHSGVVSCNKERNTANKASMKNKRSKQGHYKLNAEDEFYKGFRHFHTAIYENSAIDLAFDDGLSKVSVFIKRTDKNSPPVSTITYGNYLFSRTIDGVEYTVYGTVPYSTMDEFIKLLNSNIGKVVDLSRQGKVITKSVYN